jgi:hypothetical protein
MKEASTEYRFKTLDALKCKAIDAKAFDVIAGQIKGNETFPSLESMSWEVPLPSSTDLV